LPHWGLMRSKWRAWHDRPTPGPHRPSTLDPAEQPPDFDGFISRLATRAVVDRFVSLSRSRRSPGGALSLAGRGNRVHRRGGHTASGPPSAPDLVSGQVQLFAACFFSLLVDRYKPVPAVPRHPPESRSPAHPVLYGFSDRSSAGPWEKSSRKPRAEPPLLGPGIGFNDNPCSPGPPRPVDSGTHQGWCA